MPEDEKKPVPDHIAPYVPSFPMVLTLVLAGMTIWILYICSPVRGQAPSEFFKAMAQAVVLTGFLGAIAAYFTASRDGAKKNDTIAKLSNQLATQGTGNGSGGAGGADPGAVPDRATLEALIDTLISQSTDVMPTGDNFAKMLAEVMKQTNGKADPVLVNDILTAKLGTPV